MSLALYRPRVRTNEVLGGTLAIPLADEVSDALYPSALFEIRAKLRLIYVRLVLTCGAKRWEIRQDHW
jgi:hypothetical protein